MKRLPSRPGLDHVSTHTHQKEMLTEDPGMGTQRGWGNPGPGEDTRKEKTLPSW